MVRIWFNHWFSSVYNIISMMREGCAEELYVIGSNRNEAAVYKSMCDAWYTEPGYCEDADYVDFCLDFCKEHSVNVFVPRRGLTVIAENADRFSEIGVKLFTDMSGGMMTLLEDKAAACHFFFEKGFDCIPDVRVVRSAEEFVQAYEALKPSCRRICYKLSSDEGARSFRVIDEHLKEKNALLEKPGAKIDYHDAVEILSQYDFSIPVLVMPYLDGPEISVDCMRTACGDIIIPRYKMPGRYSEVRFDETVMQLCRRLMDAMEARMPVNIQFRMHEGRIWLLEINPRMSGGLQLSCAASGINLPAAALNQLLGHEPQWAYPSFDVRKVAHVETPVCF